MKEQIFFERLEVNQNRWDKGFFFKDPLWKHSSRLTAGRYSIGYNKDLRKVAFLKWRPGKEPLYGNATCSDVVQVSKKMEKILRAIMWPMEPEDCIPEEYR